ncbi:MAG TPA: hypothetical protein VMU85_01590 [Stellaceae bacterium]|nr:hypothetical protein [Stellaceae bacterium]
MGAILKQCLVTLGFLAGLHLAILGGTLLLYPFPVQKGGLDTASAPDTLFTTEPKYVFLDRAPLRSDKRQLILLGASNVVAGFKLRELQPLLPDMVVHNLAIGGSNVTEMREVVSLVQDELDPAARRRTIYVIGLWYGMFVANENHWATPDRHAGDTDIDIERYRYGFYRRTAEGPVAVVPTRFLDYALVAIQPYLALDRFARDAQDFLTHRPPPLTDEQRNAASLSDEEKTRLLANWTKYMGVPGPIADQQFEELARTVDDILASGSKVILVALPLPQWHERQSPYQASYVEKKNRLLARLATRPGVAILSLEDLDADPNFQDEVHPKPRVSHLWAERLANVVAAQGPASASSSR